VFKVPQALIQIIRPIKFQLEMTMPTFERMWDEKEQRVSSAEIESMISAAISEIYRKRKIHPYALQVILAGFGEALANASEHGNLSNTSKKIIIRCWFCEKGIIFSFCDEGNFFKQLKNKKAVESRTTLPSTREDPSGAGMDLIYLADKVFVSMRENTLYLAYTDTLDKIAEEK